MLFKSALVTVLSGKVGGLVASHNSFGNYFRALTIPVNPNSERQQGVRSIFQSLANAWSNDLTSVQRGRWNVYASIVVMKNKVGDDIHLSGFNHFIRTNTIAMGGQVTQIDDGPLNFTLADVDESMEGAISEATQLITVTFDENRDWVGENDALMQISMTLPANPGVYFVPPTARVAGVLLGDSISPLTSPQTIACPFHVGETNKVQIIARILRADGRLSEQFRDSLVAAS